MTVRSRFRVLYSVQVRRNPSIDAHGTGTIIGTFALLSLLPILALGLGLGTVVNSGVQEQSLAAANRSAVLLAQVGIQPLLLPSDLTTGLSEDRLAQLDSNLKGIAFGTAVARLKIWNRSSVVAYSDNRSLVGRTFPADGNLVRALGGQTASEISDASAPENRADVLTGTFLSVYVPIYLGGDSGRVAGAFELYLPWAPVAAQIDRESHRLYLLLATGLGLLYVSMIPVLLVAERWRRRLTASLAATVEERRRGEETERISALKSDFLASMSHEIRTPLNAVLGFAELLRTPGVGELNPRQDKYAQNIERAGRHLLAITNDVLDLSKIEAGQMTVQVVDVPLADVVRDAAEVLSPLSDAKSLVVSVERPIPWVKADRLRLTQVLVNLLGNAIKFTASGGSILIAARQTGESIEVDVTDTGCGIPEAQHAAVFERYAQSGSARSDGTGLGLPLSRRLIELMGGELSLVASTTSGSTFRLTVPAASRSR